jgi:hypothetical protein
MCVPRADAIDVAPHTRRLSSLPLYAGPALVYMLAGRAFMFPGVLMRSSVLVIAACLFGSQAAVAVTLPDCNAIKAWAAPVTPPADFRNAAELERARGQVAALLASPATATAFGSAPDAWSDRERAEVRQHLNYCQQALRLGRDPAGSQRVGFVMTSLPERGAAAAPAAAPVNRVPQTKREYLARNPRPAAAPANPNASTDLLDAMDALGARPGMTLSEASAAVAQWGARVVPTGRTPDSFSYQAQPDGRAYRGPPRRGLAGGLQLLAFPLDPRGDTTDPDRLIVYYVRYLLPGQPLSATDAPALPLEALRTQGASRLGRTLHQPTPANAGNRADCAHVEDYAQRMHRGLDAEIRRQYAELPAWKACGPVSVLTQVTDRGDGLITGYTIVHTDAALAERAYAALREVARQREGQP